MQKVIVFGTLNPPILFLDVMMKLAYFEETYFCGTLNPLILFLDVMMKRFIFGQKQSKRTPLDKNTSGKRVTPVPLLSVKTAEDC